MMRLNISSEKVASWRNLSNSDGRSGGVWGWVMVRRRPSGVVACAQFVHGLHEHAHAGRIDVRMDAVTEVEHMAGTAAVAGEHGLDLGLWKTLADSGLVGIALPEAVGGGGLGLLEIGVVLEEVGLATAPVVFELDLQQVMEVAMPAYRPIARFPAVRRDLAAEFDESVGFDRIRAALWQEAPPIVTDIALFDSLIVDLKINLDVIARRVAEVTDVDYDVVEILLTEYNTTRLDVRDRDVGWWVIAADVERRELRVV